MRMESFSETKQENDLNWNVKNGLYNIDHIKKIIYNILGLLLLTMRHIRWSMKNIHVLLYLLGHAFDLLIVLAIFCYCLLKTTNHGSCWRPSFMR